MKENFKLNMSFMQLKIGDFCQLLLLSTIDRQTEFDLLSNKVSYRKTVSTAEGRFTHAGYVYHYDQDNRLIETQTPEVDGHFSLSTKYHYDKNGRQIKTVLQDGHAIDYTYDRRGQMIQSSWHRDGALYRVYHSYDADGRLVHTVDSDHQTLSYEYSTHGYLLKALYPDGRSLAYQYDDYDRPVLQEDFNRRVQRFVYRTEDNGRLSAVHYGNNTLSYHYGQDDNGYQGQLLEQQMDMLNEGHTQTQYRYGPYGLLAKSTAMNDRTGMTYRVSYHYKPRGELVSQLHT